MNTRTSWKPYLFILPSFILICAFFYYPVGSAIYNSLTDLRLGVKSNFIGLENYLQMWHNELFVAGIKNQFIITAADIFKSLFFPLLAAELIYFIKGRRLSYLFKTSFIIPMLVPGMVGILLWMYMYEDGFGALNSILSLLNLDQFQHAWLREAETALPSMIFMGFPFIAGLYFLIFHAGLNGVPREYEESARIDGCKTLQVVRHIHLPLMVPYISVVAILTIIGSFQDYVKLLVTTKGGPGYSTYTPALHMYVSAFEAQQLGYGSAVGVMLFIVIIFFTVLSMKVSRKRSVN